MRTAQIVLGLGYGDEGKGHVVDYLCHRKPKSLVVRFSGGQQAGHTVWVHDKKTNKEFHHPFQSYGAGTFVGCPTYISRFCTVSPTHIVQELEDLIDLGFNPTLFIDPMAMVTTPYDIFANKQTASKHSTCGRGVGMTMKRNNETPAKFYALDMNSSEDIIRERLRNIAAFYGLDDNVDEELRYAVEWFVLTCVKTDWVFRRETILSNYDNVIFEGSQGIMLDMDHGFFPNVTYANTTSKNAMQIISDYDYMSVDIYYVTRSYQTRHGVGFMTNECDFPLLTGLDKEHNRYNDMQGPFRKGLVDYDMLKYALNVDLLYHKLPVRENLVVTCMDQLSMDFKVDELGHTFREYLHSYSPFVEGIRDARENQLVFDEEEDEEFEEVE